MSRVCGWTELQKGEFKQTDDQKTGMICPRCKGQTLWRLEVEDGEDT
jgi:hypothetical protein